MNYFCIQCFFLLVLGISWGTVIAQEKVEVTLLVDVSGSMKHNDPDNWRIPAIHLLINLFKNKALLTIFTFSTNTQSLMPTHEVTDEYEKKFHVKRHQIDALGQYTNILMALETANKSWKGNQSRFIVLLTDGAIDRGSALQNEQDKQKINTRLLPEFKKNNIRIYTIGLGKKIDEELLRSLASQTNGMYQIINSIADIEKTLYNVFTSIIPAQGLSLEQEASGARTISVDSSVSHLSIVVEKNTPSTSMALYTPEDKPYAEGKNLNLNQFIFIDVKHPSPGLWRLKGDEQPIERAIILANKELISNSLSGDYFNRELISITAQLTSAQNTETSSNLLAGMNMQLKLKNEHGCFSTTLLPVNNLFKREFILDMPPGMTNSTLTAKQGSFIRENQSLFQIMPVPFQQIRVNNTLKVTLTSPLIERDSVQIHWIGLEKSLLSSPVQNDGVWQTSIADLCKQQKPSSYFVHVEISARSTSGRQLKLTLPEEKIRCETAPVSLYSSIAPTHLNAIAEKPTLESSLTEHKKLRFWQSIHWLTITALMLLMALLIFSGWLYKKNQQIYKEKMDALRREDDF